MFYAILFQAPKSSGEPSTATDSANIEAAAQPCKLQFLYIQVSKLRHK